MYNLNKTGEMVKPCFIPTILLKLSGIPSWVVIFVLMHPYNLYTTAIHFFRTWTRLGRWWSLVLLLQCCWSYLIAPAGLQFLHWHVHLVSVPQPCTCLGLPFLRVFPLASSEALHWKALHKSMKQPHNSFPLVIGNCAQAWVLLAPWGFFFSVSFAHLLGFLFMHPSISWENIGLITLVLFSRLLFAHSLKMGAG